MAVGVIAEFNPFHNGHKYLLEAAKQNTKKCVVVIMSGTFIQRGGIAVTDKLTRTKASLNNGADLVLELPVVFSHNTAQKFAMGAVATLQATGIIDTLAFGSESADISGLINGADILADEPQDVSLKIQELMGQGISYPVARQKAYTGYFDTRLLSTPNDILALEYLRACKILNADFTPLPIKRHGADHDSREVTETIASATEIRRMLTKDDDVSSFIPSYEFDIYDEKRLDTAIISNLRLIPADRLADINEVSEGLENIFIAAAREVSNVNDLCMAVKSKRYTLSRIRRIAYSSLIGLTKELGNMSPTYIRVLGANENGRMLLREMKEKSTLPIVTKPADFKGDTIFDFNSKAEDIFSLCGCDTRAGSDLRMTPIMMDEV